MILHPSFRTAVLAAVFASSFCAGLVLAAAVFFLRQLSDGWIERYFAIFTVISGILGNSIDRIWRGAVVDFISLHYHEVYHYPIFNIADCAICVGIGVFLLSSLLRPDKEKKTAPTDK